MTKDPLRSEERREVNRRRYGSEITWTCHVCGEERPDDKISVLTTKKTLHGVEVQQNVRHCNDNPDCIEKAKDINWIPEEADG